MLKLDKLFTLTTQMYHYISNQAKFVSQCLTVETHRDLCNQVFLLFLCFCIFFPIKDTIRVITGPALCACKNIYYQQKCILLKTIVVLSKKMS